MNKKIILYVLLLIVFVFLGGNKLKADTNQNDVNIYFFYGEGCPHCALEKKYIYGELRDKYPNILIHEYEVYNNQENAELLIKIANNLGVSIDGVPFMVIGDQRFVGFSSVTSPLLIEQKVQECSKKICKDSTAVIVGRSNEKSTQQPQSDKQEHNNQSNEIKIKLPVLGEFDPLSFSLPLLTVIMGVLDGFNPCAMWTLLFLISLLLGINDRKRKWILGVAFIFASASVYFLFMSAWLNLILFLGFIVWIRVVIGLLALFGGGYSIKEFILNRGSGCSVVGDENRQKTFNKLKLIVQQKSLWLALIGIITLAFAVNLVELICSAGLPAVYTQILALNEMAGWQYYLYILLYIFFFMLDDLFIFFIAMITLEMTGITTKYSKASRLIGGLVMLIIGILLLFKPEWLMFG